jgi:hypothetical protein
VTYASPPGLVLGFHGCATDTYNAVLKDSAPLAPSTNSYDWLGSGIYFWENSFSRAIDWATARHPDNPAVIGAVIDPGHCLNLTDFQNSGYIRDAYDALARAVSKTDLPMPTNRNIRDNTDWLLRDLDCAVVNQVHKMNEELGDPWRR